LAKLSGSLFFYAGARTRRRIRRALGKNTPAQTIVIGYHHVRHAERARFARQLDHLRRWTTPVSVDFDRQVDGLRYSTVTADDGWKSFADNAVPEFVRNKIPLTIFVIANRLGDAIDDIADDRIINEDELKRLVALNVNIGSHTANHVMMTALSDADAWRELVTSREKLSAMAGAPVDLFCFPYGEYSLELADLARTAGYKRVFTSIPYLGDYPERATPRIRVDPSDWPLEFHLKIMGAYTWISRLIYWKRRLIGSRGRTPDKLRAPALNNAGAAELSIDGALLDGDVTASQAGVNTFRTPRTPLT
jgi:peptidoglycan/xylan/chitin deacetylase (PgdA/CDA1 family)